MHNERHPPLPDHGPGDLRQARGQGCRHARPKRLGASRVFLVVSRTLNTQTQEIAKLREALGERLAGVFDGIPQHTSREVVAQATRAALDAKADLIVAVGGGSVVDAAKIMTLCMEHGITDAGLEGLDPFETKPGPDGRPVRAEFRGPSVRMIAVPSTLSGGEYNAGCLVTDTRRKLKQTFFHPNDDAAGDRPRSRAGAARTRDAVDRLRHAGHGPRDRGAVLAERLAAGRRRRCSSGIRRMVDALHRSKADPTRRGGAARLPDRLVAVLVRPAVARADGRQPCDRPRAGRHLRRAALPVHARHDARRAGVQPAEHGRGPGGAGRSARPPRRARVAGLPRIRRLARPADAAGGRGCRARPVRAHRQNTMTEFFIFSNPRTVRTPADVMEMLKLGA